MSKEPAVFSLFGDSSYIKAVPGVDSCNISLTAVTRRVLLMCAEPVCMMCSCRHDR